MGNRVSVEERALPAPARQHGLDNAHRAALLGRLAGEIARLEGRAPSLVPAGRQDREAKPLRLGVAGIDRCLGAAPAAALHEVRAPATADAACAALFALMLAARLCPSGAAVFWISTSSARGEGGVLHGPGMAGLGLARLEFADTPRWSEILHVQARNDDEALWAAGEVAATPAAGLCLLELRSNPQAAGLAFTRRIALAAAAGPGAILLRQSGEEEASAAATRWRVAAAPSRERSPLLAMPAIDLELEKCRGGRTGRFLLEWRKDERRFDALARSATLPPSGLDQPAGDDGFYRPLPRSGDTPLSGAGAAASGDRPHRPAALGRGLAAARAS
jgi:protein ImuA